MNNQNMSDVLLSVEDKIIRAHKVILAFRLGIWIFKLISSRSKHFRGLLEAHRDSKDPIVISGIDYETFLMILEYIYTGKLAFF